MICQNALKKKKMGQYKVGTKDSRVFTNSKHLFLFTNGIKKKLQREASHYMYLKKLVVMSPLPKGGTSYAQVVLKATYYKRDFGCLSYNDIQPMPPCSNLFTSSHR